MAYTYDNFTQAATQAGLLGGFSEDDLKLAQSNPEFGMSVLKLRQDAQKATTTEQKLLAQAAEDQLRSSYASSLSPAGYGNYTFENQTIYQDLLDKVTGQDPFTFTPESDERYQSYKKGYLREADRARSDTLAKVSAATGGVPSSWAVSAADQAGNYYTGKLNDVVPTLYNDALNEYMNMFNMDLNALAAMQAERDFDYNAYLQEWNNALQMYNMGIKTPEILKILGIPEESNEGYEETETVKKTSQKPYKKTEDDSGVDTGSLLDTVVDIPNGNFFGGGTMLTKPSQHLK